MWTPFGPLFVADPRSRGQSRAGLGAPPPTPAQRVWHRLATRVRQVTRDQIRVLLRPTQGAAGSY